jgi:hypothetical protein
MPVNLEGVFMSKVVSVVGVEQKIYLIRGHKVMLDHDLAGLYGVATKRLNEQVRRNVRRFPSDFMFQLTWQEAESSRSQFATLNDENLRSQNAISKKGANIKYLPYAFTEQGIAMLSSVLNSQQAIDVNIAIMRAFVKLREVLTTHKELAAQFNELEHKVGTHDKQIAAIFEAIRRLMEPPPEKPKQKMGFIVDRE